MNTKAVLALALSGAALSAHAVLVCPISVTFDSAVAADGSAYDFSYRVSGLKNGCSAKYDGYLTDFYLPYFDDAGITGLVAPAGWVGSIETGDYFYGLGTEVIHYAATTPADYSAPLQVLGGFGYTASYDGVKGPYYDVFSYSGGRVNGLYGDPAIPGSPKALDALGLTAAVPEPSSVALLMAGLAAVGFSSRRAKADSSR